MILKLKILISICSSDNYFVENPFEEYVYRGYYSTVFAEGETDEYCVIETSDGTIREVTIGGENKWYMLGHVYFDRAFSEQFVPILENEFKHEAYKLQLWEDYYARHVDTLLLEARHYSDEVVKEFDSLKGTAAKQIPTMMTPTASNAITRKRFVHLMTSGPPTAINVPSKTQRVPRIGPQIPLSSTRPKLPAK